MCSSKYHNENKIPGHFLNSCPEYMLRCPLCTHEYKRSKFLNHKCAKVDPEKMKDVPKRIENIEPVILKPEHKNINEHWRLKRKGCYCAGLGRWFKVFSLNAFKDIETRTKAF